MKLLIKNGIIVNENNIEKSDVICLDGKIIEIGENLKPDTITEKLIDASDCYLFPGGIDPHVHMHLPSPAGFSSDDFKSGSRAALFGGTTTIIDFVTPKKGQSLPDAILNRKQEAQKCLTNYSLHVSPIEWRDLMEEEINTSIKRFGYKSFKVYMAYKATIGIDDDVLLKIMTVVGKAGGIVTVHCELGDEIEKLRKQFGDNNKLSINYHPLSRPDYMEAEAVKTAIEIAKQANCPIYIVHVSSEKSLNYIIAAQKEGQKVFAETCPQYLLLDDSKYEGEFENTASFVMSPPLRKKSDNQALWKGIQSGNIQTIGTDHCPFKLEQKLLGKDDFRKIPNGAGGVEHRMSLLFTYGVLEHKISILQFVASTSTNAAKIFGLYPEKGTIMVGSDADIVVWNPNKKNTISAKTHHQNCDLNIYEGINTIGEPKFVIKNGEIVNFDKI